MASCRLQTAFKVVAVLCFLKLPIATADDATNQTEPQSLASPDQCSPEKCSSIAISEKEVADFILGRKALNMYSRPRKNASDYVETTLTLSLFGIKEFAERRNSLTFEGFLHAWWQDDFLPWNTTFPYCCIKEMVMDTGAIWQADINIVTGSIGVDPTVIKPTADTRVWVESTGRVMATSVGEININCEIDLTIFPFDSQICSIIIESWDYPHQMHRFKLPKQPFIKVPYYWNENKQWEIVDNSTRIVTEKYVDQRYYDRVFFNLLIKRRPLFYHVTVVIPSAIISVAELVAFIMPVTQVLKVIVSFTCLLSYTVFLAMIIGDMPRSGENVPLLSLYIDLQMAYIGIICLLGEALMFLLFRRADHKTHPPPTWMLKTCKFLGKIMRLSNAIHEDKENRELDEYKAQIREDWLYIAETVEHINMWLYILAIIITPAIMFTALPPAKRLVHYD